ncbi:MAG: MFS transporter [Solirubrobacterales bacterium]|nr:MFS transporter [Solirubrobacterales bacterium]
MPTDSVAPVSEPRRALGSALLHVPHPHPRTGERERPAALNPTAVLVTGCAVLFLIGVNTTAINTALNAIADDLSMGSGELGWAVGIYLIAVAGFVVPAGRLGDMLGEREVMIVGLVVFAVAAILVAAADAPWMMILGRFGQGLGSAFLMPATMAALRVAYPPERQGFALGIWGAVGGVAFAIGPLIGGVLTDAASWRWVWWITFAYAAILVWVTLVTFRGMPRPASQPKLDLAGTALLAVSLFALILAIQQGPEWGWGAAGTVAAFAVSAVGLVSLVMLETRRRDPLLHLRLLRIPALVAANLGTFVNAVLLIGILYFFNLYAQATVTLDYSALGASVALLPYGVCVFGASMVIGRICDRVGFRWPIAAGLVLMGVGGLLLSRIDAASGYADIWWGTMIVGLGVGITFSAPSAAGLRAVSDEHAGEASGIINVVRYLGAALVCTLGTVVFSQAGSHDLNRALDRSGIAHLEQDRLDKTLTGAPAQLAAAERTLDPRDRRAFRAGAADGIAGGFSAVMLGLGAISLVSAVAWLALMGGLRPRRE